MTRHIATAALALGALAATALQSTPADAFPGGINIGSDDNTLIHSVAGRPTPGNSPVPAGPGRNPMPFDPGSFNPSGGGKLPPIGGNQPNPNGFGGGKLPPIGGSQPNPNGPGGNPGGGNLPPIGGSLPNPNLPWGSPGKKPHGHGPFGVYVEVGGDGGGYNPCWWLKRNYYHTGRLYWLNRYRLCLWRNFGY